RRLLGVGDGTGGARGTLAPIHNTLGTRPPEGQFFFNHPSATTELLLFNNIFSGPARTPFAWKSNRKLRGARKFFPAAPARPGGPGRAGGAGREHPWGCAGVRRLGSRRLPLAGRLPLPGRGGARSARPRRGGKLRGHAPVTGARAPAAWIYRAPLGWEA